MKTYALLVFDANKIQVTKVHTSKRQSGTPDPKILLAS
jgi:hypothetical protein